ncbi:MAG: glycosyltransferase [Candidatus Marinimicrobia bacterium]|nr:glycosyltransferase [Candidatus Neomarinimicrobiota bacterium]
MNILYISPENTVGTFDLYKRIHEAHGNRVKYVTFYHSPKGFQEDICLNLPFNFTRPFLKNMRHRIYQLYRGKEGYHKEREGNPPVWRPEGRLDAAFIAWKEKRWDPKIRKAIEKFGLHDADIVHFESGMDFYRDARFASEMKARGAGIVCHYHGEDLRTRGVLEPLDALSGLNLTNELNLMKKHPGMQYIFLPFDPGAFSSRYRPDREKHKPLWVTHAPTNRYYKGSDIIIPVCRRLEAEGLIRFILIENLPHAKAMELKCRSDIFIDQVADRGGWGYGMNSLESLALGICTLTEMNAEYESFLPDHPFINVNAGNLYERLKESVLNENLRRNASESGPEWVRRHHGLQAVGESLYDYYEMAGI